MSEKNTLACCPVTGKMAQFYCDLVGGRYFHQKDSGIIFLDPMPKVNEMAQFADEQYESGAYDKYIQAAPLKYHTAELRLRKIRKRASGNDLLDIGCSCGFFIEKAKDFEFRVKGVEFSKVAISKAQSSIRENIVCGDVNSLLSIEPTKKYDVITAFDIIEHTQNPKAFLKEVTQVLKPGGLLVLTTPDARHFLRYIMGRNWPMLQPMQHTVIFSRIAMLGLLSSCGFKEVIIETAKKSITLDYIFEQVSEFAPRLAKVYRLFKKVIPRSLLHYRVNINIGEFIVYCSKPQDL